MVFIMLYQLRSLEKFINDDLMDNLDQGLNRHSLLTLMIIANTNLAHFQLSVMLIHLFNHFFDITGTFLACFFNSCIASCSILILFFHMESPELPT